MAKMFGACASLLLAAVFFSLAASPAAAQMCGQGYPGVCVTTWQQDNRVDICPGCAYRTGQNLFEHTITYNTIQTDNFGELCSALLDGPVYSQPLVVTSVNFRGTEVGTVVYVVTQNDSVYAIDGTNCNILYKASLLTVHGYPTMTAVDCSKVGGGGGTCGTIYPTFGVVGTPVIHLSSDGSAGTLYLVAETQSVDNHGVYTFCHFLHALDITTLSEVTGIGSPIQVCSAFVGHTEPQPPGAPGHTESDYAPGKA
jgi:hypothetical protein